MAMPQVTTLLGPPAFGWSGVYGFITSPTVLFYQALDGDIVSTSSNKIVIQNEEMKIVFKGDFTLTDGAVTGGTMTGFTMTMSGTTKLLKAKDFDVDAAALYNALLAYQANEEASDAVIELLANHPTKQVGSQYDDFLFDITVETDNEWANNDTFNGKAGSDWIIGGLGDDILKGGKGNDLLSDSYGHNKMYGGEGNDVFSFVMTSSEDYSAVSKIKDFKAGKDVIGLTFYEEENALPYGYLGSQYFHKGKSATTADEHIIYDKSSGKIYYDVDGSGSEAQLLFAKVKAGTSLHADDFMVMIPALS